MSEPTRSVLVVEDVGQSHYVRVRMAELRKKVEREPSRPRLLMTETGVGYRLRPNPTEP